MSHYVIAPDGQKYGPVDLATLNTWIAGSRVYPQTMLEDAVTGATLPASTLPGLIFPGTAPGAVPGSVPPAPNARPAVPPTFSSTPNHPGAFHPGMRPAGVPAESGRFWGSMALAAAGIGIAFFLGFGSFIAIGYSLRMAWASKEEDAHPLGWVALGVCIFFGLIAIGVRIFLRQSRIV